MIFPIRTENGQAIDVSNSRRLARILNCKSDSNCNLLWPIICRYLWKHIIPTCKIDWFLSTVRKSAPVDLNKSNSYATKHLATGSHSELKTKRTNLCIKSMCVWHNIHVHPPFVQKIPRRLNWNSRPKHTQNIWLFFTPTQFMVNPP